MKKRGLALEVHPPLQPARPRVTVRRMMVAVAIVAVVFSAAVELPKLWTLRQHYLGIAEKYGYWETRINGSIERRQEITHISLSQPRGPEPSPARLARMKVEADHYARLRAKYERAARYPWLRLAPDPPAPD